MKFFSVGVAVALLVSSCNYVPRKPRFRFARRPERLAPQSALRTDGYYLHSWKWRDSSRYQQIRFSADGTCFTGPFPVNAAQEQAWTRRDRVRQMGYYRVRDSSLVIEDFIGSYVRWAWRFGIIEGDSLRIVGYKIRGRIKRRTGLPSAKGITPSVPAPAVYYFQSNP